MEAAVLPDEVKEKGSRGSPCEGNQFRSLRGYGKKRTSTGGLVFWGEEAWSVLQAAPVMDEGLRGGGVRRQNGFLPVGILSAFSLKRDSQQKPRDGSWKVPEGIAWPRLVANEVRMIVRRL